MYRQIQVNDRDIEYQRILWKSSLNASPTEFQLLTVTYGTACAPFLALRVIKQLASDDGPRFPLAAPILRDNIYVDVVLFGHHDLDALTQTRDQLTELLSRGGFELRKWASNSPSFLSGLDPANHGLACSKSLAPDETENFRDYVESSPRLVPSRHIPTSSGAPHQALHSFHDYETMIH